MRRSKRIWNPKITTTVIWTVPSSRGALRTSKKVSTFPRCKKNSCQLNDWSKFKLSRAFCKRGLAQTIIRGGPRRVLPQGCKITSPLITTPRVRCAGPSSRKWPRDAPTPQCTWSRSRNGAWKAGAPSRRSRSWIWIRLRKSPPSAYARAPSKSRSLPTQTHLTIAKKTIWRLIITIAHRQPGHV